MTKDRVNMKGVSLPEGAEPHARDVITALNEQLVEVRKISNFVR